MNYQSICPQLKSGLGMTKLSEDLATLVNNRHGSDIQFKVGGVILKENGETIHDESAIVTLYAHSAILRCRSQYFAAMLDEENNWKESTSGIIYKPNISPGTFQDVLRYIYTGIIHSESYENIIELIIAAEEMGLEELSTECQFGFLEIVKYIFSADICDDDNDDDGYTDSNDDFSDSGDSETEYKYEKIQVFSDGAVWRNIVQALNITSNHSLSQFSQELFNIILPRISVITASPDAYSIFLNSISSETLAKIITSDNLGLAELDIWDLVLDWACHQTKLTKTVVEEHLKKTSKSDNGENSDEEYGMNGMDTDDIMEESTQQKSDNSTVSIAQLKQLKAVLSPFLPAIRFSLIEAKYYARMIDTISYFLSRRRFLELHRFFLDPDYNAQLDFPRMEFLDVAKSTIIVKPGMWKLLRKCIFETGGIARCASPNQLKFDLLFRATIHSFYTSTFHARCDNKGPTLVLIRSFDGHLFGGVNFFSWHSKPGPFSSPLNFLFALPDGDHRDEPAIFKIKDPAKGSTIDYPASGPIFGDCDLKIANFADFSNESWSNLPCAYDGNGASNTALAGSKNFNVLDYEVFAISAEL